MSRKTIPAADIARCLRRNACTGTDEVLRSFSTVEGETIHPGTVIKLVRDTDTGTVFQVRS